MWVFDGEDWIQEGASSTEQKQPRPAHEPAYDMFIVPQLQIVERPIERERIVPVVPFP